MKPGAFKAACTAPPYRLKAVGCRSLHTRNRRRRLQVCEVSRPPLLRLRRRRSHSCLVRLRIRRQRAVSYCRCVRRVCPGTRDSPRHVLLGAPRCRIGTAVVGVPRRSQRLIARPGHGEGEQQRRPQQQGRPRGEAPCRPPPHATRSPPRRFKRRPSPRLEFAPRMHLCYGFTLFALFTSFRHRTADSVLFFRVHSLPPRSDVTVGNARPDICMWSIVRAT